MLIGHQPKEFLLAVSGLTVSFDGFSFAPLPELAQDRQRRAGEEMTAFEAPDRIQIGPEDQRPKLGPLPQRKDFQSHDGCPRCR